MKRLLLLFIICISSVSFGQVPVIEWQKSYGGLGNNDDSRSISNTSDGGFIICGRSDSNDGDVTFNNGGQDIWVIKLDANGIISWEKSLGGSGDDIGESIIQTNDGGYIVAGYTNSNDGDVSNNNGGQDFWIVKLDDLGNITWEKSLGGTSGDRAYCIRQTNDGGYIVAGYSLSNDGDVTTNNGGQDFWIVKLDDLGNITWEKSLGGTSLDEAYSIEQTSDDGYIVTGVSTSYTTGNNGIQDFRIVKLNSVGTIDWQTSVGGTNMDVARSIKQTSDGGFIVAGYSQSNDGNLSLNNGNFDYWIVKLDPFGSITWQKSYGGTQAEIARSIQQTIDGGYIVAGTSSSNNGDVSGNNGQQDFWIVKLDDLGNIKWEKVLGGTGSDNALSIVEISKNNYAVCGFSNSNDGDLTFNNGGNDFWVVKLKEKNIIGSVYNDYSLDCINDVLEPGLEGFTLTVSPGDLVVSTDADGSWFLDSLPIGTYNVTIDTTNLNWSTTCSITQTFNVTDPTILTQGPDFGLINSNSCSDPNVSIHAPSLRRCFSNRPIYVSARNKSTATLFLDSSYVDVELDPLLTLDNATIPYSSLGNNIFRFATGDIYPGQSVNFILYTTVSCGAQSGQTLCMDATLYPEESCFLDSIPSMPITNDGIGGTLNGLPEPCTLPWDNSSLSVDGWCQGDSVFFSITNTGDPVGGDMDCYSPMWVTVDGVVTYTDSIMINGGETVVYSYFGNGQTWILNAEQHPLHPGNSHPNAHVELCGDSTNWTPGIINQFPLDDADPTVDRYCGQVTAPLDPNDKTGYPLGQTEDFYIQPNQQLQYVIRFQNVGTDTAFNVVVRDTLDVDLNIFTVTPGVASHPYTFKMYGPRVLEWTFENIQLPDSTTNSEGSNGFLTFHVDQVPDLPEGTEITNRANIYFDFELPITTNTSVHRIFEGFVNVLNLEDLMIEGKELLIYPNPSSNIITIKSQTILNNKYKIFDQQGREVLNGNLSDNSTEVSLFGLSPGVYTIRIEGNYKPAVIIKQ
ncbi:MAG: hypothetical protein DCO96_06580 [Fluviicola sp. XM-24bin1]|nr:MAG: hypothetical protein DCO96_06580 [Fluviicola sp. XM-24bin1]